MYNLSDPRRARKSKLKIFGAIAAAIMSVGGVAHALTSVPVVGLLVSDTADHANARRLAHSSLSATAYIFMGNSSSTTITSVSYYVDDALAQHAPMVADAAPFDIAPTGLDVSKLSEGTHSLLAVITTPAGERDLFARFGVHPTEAAPTSSTCPAYPEFPDANCTGPSENLPLYTGSEEFRTDGQVVENVEIRTAGLYVPASNVTFRNVKIVYTGALDATFTIVNLNYNSGTKFENCELDGQGKVARAITGSGVEVRNCEIHGVGNAIETDTPLVVEDNYIHDIKTADGTDWHADGIQTGSGADNVIVRHNTIILTGGETGAINIMGDAANPATNVLIENNLFAGGGYTMYTGPGTNYRVINNHFSTQIFPKVGYYGIWYWDPDQDGDVVRSGNVMHETGAPADS